MRQGSEGMGKKAMSCTDLEARWEAPLYPPQPTGWLPWLVPSFALANVIAFAFTMYVNDCPSARRGSLTPGPPCVLPELGRYAFEPLTVNSLLGPSPQTLDALGALSYKRVVEKGEGWRLISCMWLHGGVIHLLLNMLSLLFTGIRLEQEFGFVKIGTLYLLSGFGGSLLSCLSMHKSISVGASGALFGLLGAMLSELIINWTIYANKCAALLTLVVVIATNLAVGLLPQVDSSAHFGGFISGFLLGFVLLIRPQFGWVDRKYIPPGYNMELVKPKHRLYQYLLWFTGFILLITGLTGGFLELFNEAQRVNDCALFCSASLPAIPSTS